MSSNRFKKIEEVYHAALEVSSERRASFLAKECCDDLEMIKEIEVLISFENNSHSFIDSTPEDFAAEMLANEENSINLVGKNIGRYKIHKVLGKGGMGTVYLAQDTRLARSVALKVLPAEMVKNEDRVQRFMHEARSASALNHPHILTVYEIDEFERNESDSIHFISMEFVEGKTFDKFIYTNKISFSDLLKYLAQVARGLSKAHKSGIVHRDLKPENIMISSDGYAKILDFGLAKLTDKENELHNLQQHKSRPGVILGTLGYMSPEQAQGNSNIDERSDIFSFGCILYEAITKQKAFEAETTIDALHKIVHTEPQSIFETNPNVPAQLVKLLEKCLSKLPENRFGEILEVAEILENILSENVDIDDLFVQKNNQKTAIWDKATTIPTTSKQFSEQRRQVTVLFADFSAISDMLEEIDPEESSDIIKDLWNVLDDLINEENGRIGERIADSFLAIWGTQSTRESDPEKAVRTALKLQAKVSNFFNYQISGQIDLSKAEKEGLHKTNLLKIGVSTGTVLLGNSVATGEFLTSGSAVNAARRLLSNAEIGDVLVSHDTYRNIRGVFEVEEAKAKRVFSLKRKKSSSKIYSIKGIKPRAFRLESRGVEGLETDLVGRESELIKMLDALDAVTEDQELQVVTVVGEAGLGKSRLLFEFQDELELLHEKYYVFKSRALETMRSLPYSLVRDLFLFRFEILEKDSQKLAREKFVKGILELVTEKSIGFGSLDEVEMKSHFIGHLIGFDFSSSEHIRKVSDDEKQLQDRAMLYSAEFFIAVSQKFPIVFFLDDLHWADDESLNFIDFIASNCVDEAVLINEFARPTLFERRPHWGEGKENHIRLNLQPLTKRDTRRLIGNILQKTENVPTDLRDLLVLNTEGNPFYLEELIKMFIEQGVIKTSGDVWEIDSDRFGEISVPPTLTGVLQARLDKLSDWERYILQRASVIGREFWDDAIEDFQADVNVQTVLESLRLKELLFRKETSSFESANEYIFKHALLRDVTYETVLLEERKKWHLETANWLIKTSGERENEYLGVIAQHFEKAKDIEKSAFWFGKAGELAQRSYALEVAESCFEKALEFWQIVSESQEPNTIKPDQVLKWKRGLGKIRLEKASFSASINIYREIFETAKGLNDAVNQAHALIGVCIAQFENGETRSSLENSKEALNILSGEDFKLADEHNLLLAKANYRIGRALVSLGEFDEAVLYANKTLEIVKDLGVAGMTEQANGFHLLAAVNLFLGRIKKSKEFELEGVKLSREIGDKKSVGSALNSLGFQSYMQGNGKMALSYYEEALEIAHEVGNKAGEIMVESNIGGAKVYLNEYESSETQLKKLIENVGDNGHFLIPESYRFLTEALIGQRKFEEALNAAKKSLKLSKESENQETISEAWRVLGIISSLTNKEIFFDKQTFSASDCFQKSLDLFKENKMEVNYAQALHNFAQHESAKGNAEKAKELLNREQEISKRLDINTNAKCVYFKNQD